MQGLTADQLKEGVTVTLNGRKPGDDAITLDLSKENYGLADWQTEFVDVKLTDDKNQAIDLKDLIKDQTYNVKVTISPKHEGTETEKSGNGTVQINVFKPEITWKDSQIDLGEKPSYTEGDNQNLVGVVWKHKVEGQPETTDEKVSMTGTKPELAYAFTPEATTFQKDTPVKVTVKIGNEDINKFVTFIHQACDENIGCKWEEVKNDGYHFIVHIKSFDLIIHKTGDVDSKQTFILRSKRGYC